MNKSPQKKFSLFNFILLCFGLGLLISLIFDTDNLLPGNTQAPVQIAYSELANEIDASNILSIEISRYGSAKGIFRTPIRDNLNFEAQGFPPDTELIAYIRSKNPSAIIKILEEEQPNRFMHFLFTWGPMLLLVGFFIFMVRNMSGGGISKVLPFAKSKAKLVKNIPVNFKDVAGVDEAKAELQEIVGFLKDPQKFQKLGARIPKGVLLIGTPGTGKTLLARAVAGEANVSGKANVNFYSISGSDFVEMFVGVGASRVRDLFEQGKQNAPSIIFIDEIDAVGRHRGAGRGNGHDEREQTLNQLLSEMDGFEANNGVIVIAATNRIDVLDPALLRPGRFDRRVIVDKPDIKGRTEILEIHVRKIPLADNVELKKIARGTSGFSGADLANLVNEAAIATATDNRKLVENKDFEFAKDKVLMGSERRSIIISEEEKKVTAVHEAGHSILAAVMPHADPLHKITIIPRGMSMGSTWQLPEEDRHNYSKGYLLSYLAILMGGRAAEELIFNEVTSGASNDIERVTSLAKSMVCEWGMSKLGPQKFGSHQENPFGESEMPWSDRNYSNETAREIDTEVKKLISEAYDTATKVLSARINSLHAISQRLIAKETIDGEDVREILNQKESD